MWFLCFSPSQSSSCCPHHCCTPPLPTYGSCWFLCPEPWGLLSPVRCLSLYWTDCCCSLHASQTRAHRQRDSERKGRWDEAKRPEQNCTFNLRLLKSTEWVISFADMANSTCLKEPVITSTLTLWQDLTHIHWVKLKHRNQEEWSNQWILRILLCRQFSKERIFTKLPSHILRLCLAL